MILSGIDQVNVLQKGTIDQVKRATEAAIKRASPAAACFGRPPEPAFPVVRLPFLST